MSAARRAKERSAERSNERPNEMEQLEIGYSTKFTAYTGDEPYLFVSYSHRDCRKVYETLDRLYDKKFRIWYDESCENGGDFRDELRHRIEKAEAVILFVSSASMSSPFCGMEIIVARENKKKIHPVYLEEIPLPPAFELLLANTHHGSIKDMNKLIADLARDLPAEAMDRLDFDDPEKRNLKKIEDNGSHIDVADGVINIAEQAAKERRQLVTITLPESLETIGLESFRGCSKLREIDIPEKTKDIGGSAFRDCVSMRTLVIRNDSVKIGERAFENCSGLEEVSLPDGLTEIYGGVFNSCRRLKKIKLPSKLTILGESAFSDCVGLEEVDVPATVTKIDDLVFNGCEGMKTITLHEGLRKIGKAAFKNCINLSTVELPETVTGIGDAPFRGCSNLRSITVSTKNKYFKSAPIGSTTSNECALFNKNKSILIAYPANSQEISYMVPDSVVTICDWAFSFGNQLGRINIPDSVREIGEGAFSNCQILDKVVIPDSVERIDDCAFRGCKKLATITIPSSVAELGWGVFDGCSDNLVVYCDENTAIHKYCLSNRIKTDRIENRI